MNTIGRNQWSEAGFKLWPDRPLFTGHRSRLTKCRKLKTWNQRRPPLTAVSFQPAWPWPCPLSSVFSQWDSMAQEWLRMNQGTARTEPRHTPTVWHASLYGLLLTGIRLRFARGICKDVNKPGQLIPSKNLVPSAAHLSSFSYFPAPNPQNGKLKNRQVTIRITRFHATSTHPMIRTPRHRHNNNNNNNNNNNTNATWTPNLHTSLSMVWSHFT